MSTSRSGCLATTIDKIVVLGANGAMGSASGAVFASAGVSTVFLARTLEKAEAGRTRAEQLAKGKIPAGCITCGTYDDLETALADADLIFEAVSEDLATKSAMFERVDRARRAGSIVATVSSGLSIAAMCRMRSPDYRAHFLGIHLFNPPTVILGCEVIPHSATDPEVLAVVHDFLVTRCGREVIETADTPAFAGNRLGFKLLNEVAQLAEEHGVAFIDQLVGPHTGRVLPPLATIDLVGWDVHAAIVDNLWSSTQDAAHDAFALPEYMRRGIAAGILGRKTRDVGGFFRMTGKGDTACHFVLDPQTLEHLPLVRPELPTFVTAMRDALRAGDHTDAMAVLCAAQGTAAEVLRRILLGYISYGLGLVGSVVAQSRDIDRIMGFGFSWAPPGVLVDAIGPDQTIRLLEQAKLPIPHVILEAASFQRAVFDEPAIDRARYFPIAA